MHPVPQCDQDGSKQQWQADFYDGDQNLTFLRQSGGRGGNKCQHWKKGKGIPKTTARLRMLLEPEAPEAASQTLRAFHYLLYCSARVLISILSGLFHGCWQAAVHRSGSSALCRMVWGMEVTAIECPSVGSGAQPSPAPGWTEHRRANGTPGRAAPPVLPPAARAAHSPGNTPRPTSSTAATAPEVSPCMPVASETQWEPGITHAGRSSNAKLQVLLLRQQ